jgi:hypothetical protein
MNTKTDRFKVTPSGGYFATTYDDFSSFRRTDHHKPIVPAAEELPNGRPLWLSEINKQVPEAARYELDRQIGSTAKILATRVTSFKNHNEQLNCTTDKDRDLSKHQKSLHKIPYEGVASYDIKLNAVKKSNPSYTTSAFCKKSTLWDECKPFIFAAITFLQRSKELKCSPVLTVTRPADT